MQVYISVCKIVHWETCGGIFCHCKKNLWLRLKHVYLLEWSSQSAVENLRQELKTDVEGCSPSRWNAVTAAGSCNWKRWFCKVLTQVDKKNNNPQTHNTFFWFLFVKTYKFRRKKTVKELWGCEYFCKILYFQHSSNIESGKS